MHLLSLAVCLTAITVMSQTYPSFSMCHGRDSSLLDQATFSWTL